MADGIILGMMSMHTLYGFLFFWIGCLRRPRPSLLISAVAILFWPIMVHHLMDRAAVTSPQGNSK